ncbi:hypothetical protein FOYG_04591 [Fusarium oxysporum NRRL 32931]|uniref:Uncharacterized protein n=1 Tax=Fusarium oxysporum NRRL 32931 TaxID=660029 RepID=W9ILS6_FUSOX|nr:hypothetical protein FOYG_04591 [Fusarium oxysporum NRRL 32931]
MFLAKEFSSSSLLIIHLLILSSRFPLPITLPSLQNGLPPFTRSRYFLTWEPSSLPAHTKSEFSSPALISDVETRRRLAKSYKTQDKTTSFPIFRSLGFDLDLINLTLQQEGSDFAVLQFTSELSNGEAPSGDVDADDNDDDGLYDHTLSSSHLSQALPAQSGSPEEPYPKTIFDIQDCENANITSLDNFDLSLKALKGPGSGLDSWSSPIQLVATYEYFGSLKSLEKSNVFWRFMSGAPWMRVDFPYCRPIRVMGNETAILIVLQCPRQHLPLNPASFTDMFIAAVVSYFDKQVSNMSSWISGRSAVGIKKIAVVQSSTGPRSKFAGLP